MKHATSLVAGVWGGFWRAKAELDTLRTCLLLSLLTMRFYSHYELFGHPYHTKSNIKRAAVYTYTYTSTSARHQTPIPVKIIKILAMPGSQAGDKMRQPLPQAKSYASVACSNDESEYKVSFLH